MLGESHLDVRQLSIEGAVIIRVKYYVCLEGYVVLRNEQISSNAMV